MKILLTYLAFFVPIFGIAQTVSLQSNGAGGSNSSVSGIHYSASVGGTAILFAPVRTVQKENNAVGSEIDSEIVAELAEMRAFPNPCIDNIAVYFPKKLKFSDFEYKITSITGQEFKLSSQISDNQVVFDFSKMIPGIYSVTFFSLKNNYTKTFKVIKTN